MFILSTKLKNLKNELKIWNKQVFGNIHSQVSDAEANLANIQSLIQTSGHTDQLQNQENLAHLQLDDALNKQHIFWQEKARVNWHLEGDRNTKFFHRVTKIKNKTKLISSIRDENDIISDPNLVANHIVSYYKNLFSSNFVLQEPLLVDEVIPNLLDDNINNLLTLLPSGEEIKKSSI